jgi:hypothetical protein
MMARLYGPGATLADVPPDFVGISWSAWESLAFAAQRAEAQRLGFGYPSIEAFEQAHPVRTARDQHGWRGRGAYIRDRHASLFNK